MLFPKLAAVELEWHDRQLLLNRIDIVPAKVTLAVSHELSITGYRNSSLS
jgi:hypothetical protein